MQILDFLTMQRELQIKMREANPTQGGDPYMMAPEDLAVFVTWNHTALIKELGEALDECGWKPWASARNISGDEAIREMVDAWHFFMNILLAFGSWMEWSPEEVAKFFEEYYIEKNAKNLQRQIEGYDGVKDKCPNCHREVRLRSAGEFICYCGQRFHRDADGTLTPKENNGPRR